MTKKDLQAPNSATRDGKSTVDNNNFQIKQKKYLGFSSVHKIDQ